ncbi:Arc family DNA-binding protein [Ancylobacter sp. 6x-1]|uniref:Arc family DNA-binding protein n=1 Tax=Ancylobacter crimeensis TaxID=2579147 RepID=A0ABT0DC80_9HYPH|nr:Arc family DNA-binding protein [Ancylobacter crimeensis]MCK0197563.1 Arc family DNA-binding protein [Ancylobacter crimeensis]
MPEGTDRKGRRGLSLRLPPEMKRWLDERAERNGSSINSEVARCIRAKMDMEPIERAAAERFVRDIAEIRIAAEDMERI